MEPTLRDQFLKMPSYSTYFGSTPGRGELILDGEVHLNQRKIDSFDENAAMNDDLYNYLREELRSKTQELSILREIISQKDQTALCMQNQLEKIVTELEEAVRQALDDQERITIELETKVDDLKKVIEEQNQNMKQRDEAQNMADKNAGDREENFAKSLDEKNVLIADLREQLQQNRTRVAKKVVSKPRWSWW